MRKAGCRSQPVPVCECPYHGLDNSTQYGRAHGRFQPAECRRDCRRLTPLFLPGLFLRCLLRSGLSEPRVVTRIKSNRSSEQRTVQNHIPKLTLWWWWLPEDGGRRWLQGRMDRWSRSRVAAKSRVESSQVKLTSSIHCRKGETRAISYSITSSAGSV
ncbi:hypothetical protein BDW69DRAFT_167922 [Aspergillus filifer]